MKLKEENRDSRLKRHISLSRENRLAQIIKSKDFRVPGRFYISSFGYRTFRVRFTPKNPDDARKLANDIMDLFKLNKSEIKFDESDGTFYYWGERDNYFEKYDSLWISITNISPPENCQIKKVKKVVERYERVCHDQKPLGGINRIVPAKKDHKAVVVK